MKIPDYAWKCGIENGWKTYTMRKWYKPIHRIRCGAYWLWLTLKYGVGYWKRRA